MNKSELIKEIASKGQLDFNEATNAVDTITETIAETMHKRGSITLVGFGNFVVQERKARKGHNPAADGPMLIPTERQAKFRPGSKMKLE